MSNYTNNNFSSKDDMNMRNNQPNYGLASTGRLNNTNGFQPMNNNPGRELRESSAHRPLDQAQLENVYQNGTFGINKFEKIFFKEADQNLISPYISNLDRFYGFELDELRYIDWKIKKNNPGTLKDTPEFSRINNTFPYNSTAPRCFDNYSVSKNTMGMNLINTNNLPPNNNNDINAYLRPHSTQGLNPNKPFSVNNTLQSNSLNSTSTNTNNNFGSTNPTGNTAFNKNQFSMNINSSNYGTNGGTPSNVIPNKSFGNFFDNQNTRVFPVATTTNPVAMSSGFNNINNNLKSFQSVNMSGTGSTTNSFNTNVTPNQIPAKNQNPFGSVNSTAFNTNNNYIGSTSSNINFGMPTGTNTALKNQFNAHANQSNPMTNNLNMNQNNSSVQFATDYKPNPMNNSSNNNFNFSTPSQSLINIQAGGNTNTNFQNRPQDNQFGISNNTINNNQSNFGYGNNQAAFNFKSSANSGSNITFNNSYTTQNNINQAKSLNSIYEVLQTVNSNDDYLGIKSLCQEVNTNLNKFNKKEIEELFDLDSHEEKSSYTTGNNQRNNNITSSNQNRNYTDSAVRDNNSIRMVSFNNNLPYKNSSMMQANNKNNKENSYSQFNSNIRNQHNSIEKPVDRYSFIQNDMKERSSSKDSGFKFHENSFKRPVETAKKPLTIQDILPLNNNKKTVEANLIEKVDNLEERANNGLNIFRSNILPENKIKTHAEINTSNYYKSAEYRNEILKIADELHRKCVGGPSPSSSKSDQKFRNINPVDKNLFPSKNNFSTEKKPFSKFTNQLPSFFKSNKNMNTIYESREESENILVDLKAIDNLDNFVRNKQEKILTFNLDGVLNLKFKITSPVIYNFSMRINKKNPIIDLRNAMHELLKEKFPHDFENLIPENIIIFCKSGALKDDDIIEAKSFVNENETISVFIVNDSPLPDEDSQYKFSHKENFIDDHAFDQEDANSLNGLEGFLNYPTDNTRDREIKSLKEIIRPEYCPYTKKYQTEPTYVELTKMSKEQLSRISNFTISNQFGKITWTQPIDITYLNFDEIVQISHLFIEVYPNMNSPKFGEKLNMEAKLHLYNLECPKEAQESEEQFWEFIQSIKKDLVKNNAHFVDFIKGKSELIFKVKAFTKECI